MEPRMNRPWQTIPGSYRAMSALGASTRDESVLPWEIQELVRLRASQINGCGFCVDMHAHDARTRGETDERLFSVAAWREAPWYSDAERAALALTEAVTRLADREDAVPDHVWADAAEQFDEKALATLIATIATINAWNRIAVTTRQVAGSMRKAGAGAH